MAGGKRPGAGRPKQDFCKYGHSLNDPDNLYTDHRGHRGCKACRRRNNTVAWRNRDKDKKS